MIDEHDSKPAEGQSASNVGLGTFNYNFSENRDWYSEMCAEYGKGAVDNNDI